MRANTGREQQKLKPTESGSYTARNDVNMSSQVTDVAQYEALCYKARIALEMIAGSSYETKHFLRTFRNGAYVPLWEHACRVTHFHWELDGDVEWLTVQVEEVVDIALDALRSRRADMMESENGFHNDQDYYRMMYNVHKCDMYIARLCGTADESEAKHRLKAARDIAKAISHQEDSPIEGFWDAEANIVGMMVEYAGSQELFRDRMHMVVSIREAIEDGVEDDDTIKTYVDTYLTGHVSAPKLIADQWSPMSSISDIQEPPVNGFYIPPHARGVKPVPDAGYAELRRGTPYQMYVLVGKTPFQARNVGYVRYALKQGMPVYSMMGGRRMPYDHAAQTAWEIRNSARLRQHVMEHVVGERRAPGEMRLV